MQMPHGILVFAERFAIGKKHSGEQHLSPTTIERRQRHFLEAQYAEQPFGRDSAGMFEEHRKAQIIVTVFQQLIDVIGWILQQGMLLNGLNECLVQRQIRQHRGNAAVESIQCQSFLRRGQAEVDDILMWTQVVSLHQFRRADFLIHRSANRRVTIPFDLRDVVGRRCGERDDDG